MTIKTFIMGLDLGYTKDYYVLSNSIAKKSTTMKIEGIFRSRRQGSKEKAVVQVKFKKYSGILDALDFKEYLESGYKVYFYGPIIKNEEKDKNCIQITDEDLLSFYNTYKENLSESITVWEELIRI